MRLKTKLLIGSTLFFGVGSLLLLRIHVKGSIEQLAETALDQSSTMRDTIPKKRLNPEFENFLSWYQPMVKDASPEVRAVMKKFDPKYRKGGSHGNEEIERHLPTDEWIQRLLDMGVKFEDYSDYSAYLGARWRIFHAQNDIEALDDLKQRHSLASEASWDDVITAHIKGRVQLHTLTEQAIEGDMVGACQKRVSLFLNELRPFMFSPVLYVLVVVYRNGLSTSSEIEREAYHRQERFRKILTSSTSMKRGKR